MTTVTTDIYRKLREQLISGLLRPGARLSELALAEQFGTSRTPIREAIRELAAQGFVEQIPKSGSFVRSVRREDLVGLFHLREWIECGAVVLAVEWIDGGQLATLEKACHDFEALAYEYRDAAGNVNDSEMWERREQIESDFHLTLLRAAANPPALEIIRNQRILTRTWQVAPLHQKWHDVLRYAQEHQEVLEAVRRGDAETAAETLRRHIRGGHESTLAAYDRHQQKLAMEQYRDADARVDSPQMVNVHLKPKGRKQDKLQPSED